MSQSLQFLRPRSLIEIDIHGHFRSIWPVGIQLYSLAHSVIDVQSMEVYTGYYGHLFCTAHWASNGHRSLSDVRQNAGGAFFPVSEAKR